MNHLLKIIVTLFCLTSAQGHAQAIYDKLEKAIFDKSQAHFDSILTDYCKIYKPADTTLIISNDTLNNLYKIHHDFYENLFYDSLSASKHYNYFLIPQSLKIGFVKKIKQRNDASFLMSYNDHLVDFYFPLSYNNELNKKCDFTYLYDFRPKLTTDKTVCYLDSALEHTIDKLYKEQYRDTIPKYENLKYFNSIPQVWSGATFDIGSAPHLDFVLFDKKLKKSILYYKFLGSQHAMILEKGENGWHKIYQDLFMVY